jgi:hypothetical protein
MLRRLEPEDPASSVTNLFYAYENLIVAIAEAHQLKWVTIRKQISPRAIRAKTCPQGLA